MEERILDCLDCYEHNGGCGDVCEVQPEKEELVEEEEDNNRG